MPLLLNIDTSTENASLCLSEGEECLCLLSNSIQKEHASWLHPAIQEALRSVNRKITELEAVAITAGPGSYTGLRVAMASAKGLCYALRIPLIAVGTLEAMAHAALAEDTDYVCPCIDARRMEIFTAVYDKNLTTILQPQNMVVQTGSFADVLAAGRVLFFGNGSKKMEPVIQDAHAIFRDIPFSATHLSVAALKRFRHNEFTPLALSGPLYLKEFYSPLSEL